MIKTYNTPDGRISITWDGTLPKKIELLEEMGVQYTPTPDDLEEDALTHRIRDEYVGSVATLEQIINFSGTITIAILGGAVKDIARILLLLLKLLRRLYSEE